MRQASYGVSRYLDENGDGSGNKNANGDYSVTPQEFFFQPVREVALERIIISIEGSMGMRADAYGPGMDALINGWELLAMNKDQLVQQNFTDGVPIRTNASLGRFCFDIDMKTWGIGAPEEMLVARFTFSRMGQPLLLRAGERISITLNDDLSHLIDHMFVVQGYYSSNL